MPSSSFTRYRLREGGLEIQEFSNVTYKDPSFQDRASQSAAAKQKALDNLRRKPPADETAGDERKAAGDAGDAGGESAK